jgi:hypothetical protein
MANLNLFQMQERQEQSDTANIDKIALAILEAA